MKKPVYKLLDEKGRILIPKEFRQMAELESGDIVKARDLSFAQRQSRAYRRR